MTSVLIVEDDPFIRDITTIKCTEHGYTVNSCASAEAGLTALDTGRFDIVILDLDLPDMSGVALFEDIRTHSNGKDAKVIIFSNSTDPKLREAVTNLGMLAFFEKSSTQYEELFTLIDAAMLTSAR
jgi:DNA-binding response OmpR family regulator